MELIRETAIDCPYCGEAVTILVDGSAGDQHYVEDCEVCCRPMQIRVSVSETGVDRVEALSEND